MSEKQIKDNMMLIIEKLFLEDRLVLRYFWNPDFNNGDNGDNGDGGEFLKWVYYGG